MITGYSNLQYVYTKRSKVLMFLIMICIQNSSTFSFELLYFLFIQMFYLSKVKNSILNILKHYIKLMQNLNGHNL